MKIDFILGVTPIQTKLSLLKDIILSLPLNHIYSLQLVIRFLHEISLHVPLSSSSSSIFFSSRSSPSSSPLSSPHISPASSPRGRLSLTTNVSQDKEKRSTLSPFVNTPSLQRVNSFTSSSFSSSYAKSKKSLRSTFAPLLLRKEYPFKLLLINISFFLTIEAQHKITRRKWVSSPP